jgi:magnesium chelatase family protein
VANAVLPSGELRSRACLQAPARVLLRHACSRLGLSARSHDRVIKVARTIADLAGAVEVDDGHVGEALRFRGFDRHAVP